MKLFLASHSPNMYTFNCNWVKNTVSPKVNKLSFTGTYHKKQPSFKPHMGQILDYTLNNHFGGNSCSEPQIMVLISNSTNLHTRSNCLELYFRKVTYKIYLKQ